MDEIRIRSAYDYFEMIHEIRMNRRTKEHVSCLEFYRGQANASWKVIPTLYRWYPKEGSPNPISLYSFEKSLVDEFSRARPDEFPANLQVFDKLTKMQHYGMHTRLIDVTSNPAVALYFACCDQNREPEIVDGEIHIFPTMLDEIPDNDTINLITDYIMNSRVYGGSLEESYIHFLKIYPKQFVDQAFKFLTFSDKLYARPKVISERMLRQSGYFILCTGLLCPDSGCKNQVCKTKKCVHREGKEHWQLNYSIEEKVKHVSVQNRYYDSTDFDYKHQQDDIRYIIDGGSKKKILSELETIGINKVFLFPELQNESKRILDDYMSRVT